LGPRGRNSGTTENWPFCVPKLLAFKGYFFNFWHFKLVIFKKFEISKNDLITAKPEKVAMYALLKKKPNHLSPKKLMYVISISNLIA
jgi:hypothetical protein